MSAGEETHSQCNVTKIPKICVDNNLEMVDCYDGGLCGKSEEDFYIAEEQTFGINELSYLSRLSCASNHKKFLLAVVLLSQCSEGYRHATLQWLNNTTMESSEGSDQVFADCEENRSTVLSSNSELLERLKKFGLQYNDKSCQHLRHDSVPNKLEDDHIEFYSIPQAKNLTNDLPSDIELITQNSQKIKKQYLELVSEKFVSSLLDDYDALMKEIQCSNAPLREVAVQTSVGQLFIATILHTSLNEDDRKWLLSSIQSKYKKMSGEDNLSSKENSMDDDLRSKLFDCLIDLGLDLSCALQRMKSDASLSHSLTSSGFLSGSGGSDSQYDLLMEASNSGSQTINTNNTLNNTKTNYGTLLTVPNADGKCGLSNSFYNCLYPFNSSSHFSYRRLSDIPTVSNFYSSPSPSSSSSSSQCPTQPASNENNEGNKTLDDVGSDSNQNTATVAKDFNDLPVVSSSELPTTVQTPAVDTDDGQAKSSSNVDCQQRVSISSTLSDSSSISSSNPDLGICVPHSPTSIVLTSTSPELVKNFENLSIYTSNSLNQCLTKTSESECPSDDRNSMTNQHSNMMVNDHCSSSSATSLNINIYPHMMTSHCHPREELLDHVSINFPETQDGSSQCFSVSTNSVKAISSNDGRCTSQYSSTTEENNFLNPFSGMTAVPFWLKSLRLHKYASLFQNLSYDEMMSITDDWLKEHDVTQGARNKILLSIEKLKHRKSILCTMEKCLSEIPSTGQLARSTVHSCLSEIKHILLTPIKPCFFQSINNHSMHLCQPASACASSSSSSPSPSSSSASASASVSSSSSSSSSVVILTSGKSTMPTTLTTITTTTTTTPTAINTMTNSTHLTCPITVIQTTDNANTEDHLIRGGGVGGVGNIHDNKSRDNNNPCNTCNTSSIANPIIILYNEYSFYQ
ncbi:unnamed protein product [Trichobilharzia szidati]|nr:unnamed protein product [Trichobilharzia szidati]